MDDNALGTFSVLVVVIIPCLFAGNYCLFSRMGIGKDRRFILRCGDLPVCGVRSIPCDLGFHPVVARVFPDFAFQVFVNRDNGCPVIVRIQRNSPHRFIILIVKSNCQVFRPFPILVVIVDPGLLHRQFLLFHSAGVGVLIYGFVYRAQLRGITESFQRIQVVFFPDINDLYTGIIIEFRQVQCVAGPVVAIVQSNSPIFLCFAAVVVQSHTDG